MADESVKVIVRCRPMNERERNLNCGIVIKTDSSRGQCTIQPPNDPKAPPKSFTFDGSFYFESTTEQIYEDIAYPLVEGVTEGYNGTIFAYGQTGCGKSFTMQGIKEPASQKGIIPRAFEHIFETVSVSEGTKFLIQAAFLEIYQEEIRDLLGDNVKAKLDLKEHPEKGVYVNKLSKFTVHSVTECEALMERGWKNRSTGATLMNTDSSRSHSIFTINVEMCRPGEDGEEHIRAGKLNLVDLAGSERQNKTGATGERLREATKINLSLSSLGNVISALVDGKSTHIPYRDSKLTRLLQDSLGGNTKTLMIACLSPADNNYEESLSTLRYANRAKNIKNKPKINEDPKDALLREYQEEISKLKAMLAGQLPLTVPVAAPEPMIVEKVVHVDYNDEIEDEKHKIREEYESKISELNSMYETERVTKAKLQDDMHKLREFYDDKLNSVDGKYANLPTPAAILGERGYENYIVASPEAGNVTNVTSKSMAANAETILDGGKARTAVEETVDGAKVETSPDVAVPQQGETPTTQQSPRPDTLSPIASPAPPPVTPLNGLVTLPSEQAALAKRLHELELQMVGGENADNAEVKERRKKKRKHAEEKKKKLADANSNLEDDGIMEGIFDSIHDELRAKNKLLEREKQKATMLERELCDIQSEFEFDRIEYLDTIRKQQNEMDLLKALLDKVQPCVRRDCNYSNLDKIRSEAKWDEDEGKWIVPQLKVEKTSLPGGMPGGGSSSGSHAKHRPSASTTDSDDDDRDKYLMRLQRSNKEEAAKSYFTAKRAGKLLNNQQELRNGFVAQETTSHQNGHLPPALIRAQQESNFGDLRAAQVHGQNIDPELPIRKPVRLSSLPPASASKKSRRKSRGLDSL